MTNQSFDLEAVKARRERVSAAIKAKYSSTWTLDVSKAVSESEADVPALIAEVERLRARQSATFSSMTKVSTIRSMVGNALFNLRQGASMDHEQLIRLLEDIEATTLKTQEAE